MDVDAEWDSYLANETVTREILPKVESVDSLEFSELYISTKTKVLFVNQQIDINTVFWKIPIVEYWKLEAGVIKKQMKIVSKDPKEYEELQARLVDVGYYLDNVIKQIDNPSARRIKFKDERKITIGIHVVRLRTHFITVLQ